MFRLKQGPSVSGEVRRLALRQLDLAVRDLRAAGDARGDEAVHDARRHVKKIRAMIRLVHSAHDSTSHAVDRELGAVSRLLAPVADGQGITLTVEELARRYGHVLPRSALAAARGRVGRNRARADMQARANGVLDIAAATLEAQHKSLAQWRIRPRGFRAIEPGLQRSYRRARRLMMAASARPVPPRFHRWRRYVKDTWFHVRLLEGPCGNRLASYEHQLETLDGLLGEYHNLTMLREVLAAGGSIPPAQLAPCLEAVDRYERALRRQAGLLGLRIYAARPRQYVERIRGCWRAASHDHGAHGAR